MEAASLAQGDPNLLVPQTIPVPDSQTQTHSASNLHIKRPSADEDVEDLKNQIRHLEELLILKTQKLDNMTQTLTQYKQLLRLSAEEEEKTDTDHDQQTIALSSTGTLDRFGDCLEAHPNEVIVRSASTIKLQVQVMIGGKVPKSMFTYHFTAATCSMLSDLRAQVVSAGSLKGGGELQRATLWNDGHLLRLMKDLRRVTFRLQEDGHVARMNVTPTKVDGLCAFPETEYEAWFYRNILRGNLKEYRVEVKIDV